MFQWLQQMHQVRTIYDMICANIAALDFDLTPLPLTFVILMLVPAMRLQQSCQGFGTTETYLGIKGVVS